MADKNEVLALAGLLLAGVAVLLVVGRESFTAGQPRAEARGEVACPATPDVLTAPLIAPGDIVGIEPMGATAPPGEPLPSLGIEIFPNTGRVPLTVPADGSIAVVEAMVRDGVTSYRVTFKPCADVRVSIEPIATLAEPIMAALAARPPDAVVGNRTITRLDLDVTAGSALGTAGQVSVILSDRRVPAAPAANPDRHALEPVERDLGKLGLTRTLARALAPDALHARCPIEAYPPAIETELGQKLGDRRGIIPASGDPRCGLAIPDVPGTAQGIWFSSSSGHRLTTPTRAAALVPDAVMAAALKISLGEITPALEPGDYLVSPVRDGGTVNRHFAGVRPSAVHCYETLSQISTGRLMPGVVLIALDDGGARMRFEYLANVPYCQDLAQPWTFQGTDQILSR